MSGDDDDDDGSKGISFSTDHFWFSVATRAFRDRLIGAAAASLIVLTGRRRVWRTISRARALLIITGEKPTNESFEKNDQPPPYLATNPFYFSRVRAAN